MIRLALLRHGHTDWNRAGKIQGHRDIPLDPAAVAELANFQLPDVWLTAALVSSPLSRAVHTAELVTERTPQVDHSLIEMDYGDWEGRRNIDLNADSASGFRHLPDWGWDYQPPNGESPAQVWTRLAPWVAGLTEDTVAVCHIGIMRVLLAIAHDWHFKGEPPFSIKRNSLYCLEVADKLTVADPLRVRLISKDSANRC